MKLGIRYFLVFILFIFCSQVVNAQGIVVSFKSPWNGFLQAWTTNELHAANTNRSHEETWYLVDSVPSQHIYGLKNYRTNRFLSKNSEGGNADYCVQTNRGGLDGQWEQFELISGAPYGFPNKVAIKSLKDGTFLGANPPGDDTHCGGEVSAGDTTPHFNDGNWPGYWEMEVASTVVCFIRGPWPCNNDWKKIGEVPGLLCELTGYCD